MEGLEVICDNMKHLKSLAFYVNRPHADTSSKHSLIGDNGLQLVQRLDKLEELSLLLYGITFPLQWFSDYMNQGIGHSDTEQKYENASACGKIKSQTQTPLQSDFSPLNQSLCLNTKAKGISSDGIRSLKKCQSLRIFKVGGRNFAGLVPEYEQSETVFQNNFTGFGNSKFTVSAATPTKLLSTSPVETSFTEEYEHKADHRYLSFAEWARRYRRTSILELYQYTIDTNYKTVGRVS